MSRNLLIFIFTIAFSINGHAEDKYGRSTEVRAAADAGITSIGAVLAGMAQEDLIQHKSDLKALKKNRLTDPRLIDRRNFVEIPNKKVSIRNVRVVRGVGLVFLTFGLADIGAALLDTMDSSVVTSFASPKVAPTQKHVDQRIRELSVQEGSGARSAESSCISPLLIGDCTP